MFSLLGFKRKPKYTYQWIYESVEWPDGSEDPNVDYDSGTVVAVTDMDSILCKLERECWDSIDNRGDGTIICYPADHHQDYVTGVYTSNQLIIKARSARLANKLMDQYEYINLGKGL